MTQKTGDMIAGIILATPTVICMLVGLVMWVVP